MLKRIKNLFKRKNRPKYPTFTITIEPDMIGVTADWPSPENLTQQEIMTNAARSVKTIMGFTCGNGPGLNEVQRAVGRNAELRKDQEYANIVIGLFKMAIENSINDQYSQPDENLMSPLQVFPASGQRNE